MNREGGDHPQADGEAGLFTIMEVGLEEGDGDEHYATGTLVIVGLVDGDWRAQAGADV